MIYVSILVPVLSRPSRAATLVKSVKAATSVGWELVFVCSPHDHEQIGACRHIRGRKIRTLVMDSGPDQGDYAAKINRAFRETKAPWVFQAADDLRFRPGWAEQAIETGEHAEVGVVGTNDLGNRRTMIGSTSTHSLIRRAYIDECGGSDEPGVVLHEGYWHNFVDDELVGVAKSRGCFAAARGSIVEHLHPNWRKAEDDDTYRRGMEHFAEDAWLFRYRRSFWQGSR